MNLVDIFPKKMLVSLLIIFVVACVSQESPAPTEILRVPTSTQPVPTQTLAPTATLVPTVTLTPKPTETPWQYEYQEELLLVYVEKSSGNQFALLNPITGETKTIPYMSCNISTLCWRARYYSRLPSRNTRLSLGLCC